ncbi:MAG: hypothetical protein RL742_1289 [Bacteroidota bacterium]|jgi:transcriptional regulator with XRE-family HTH domain
MRIGKNLIRRRFARGWSQEDVARMAGMSQPNYSKIESDKQDVTQEQIEAFARLFEISVAELLAPDAPVFQSIQQQGGHANNYFVQHGLEAVIAAKDETIGILRSEMAEMRERLHTLEAELGDCGSVCMMVGRGTV